MCSLLGFYAPEAGVRSRSQAFLHSQGSDRVRGLSLINDLAAVITASDPSERRMKLFGIDCGRKRCQVVGFYNSAGAIQKRRYEACIEIRQARPKSAREIDFLQPSILSQGSIGKGPNIDRP
jgi:hypothetical protein